MPNVIMNQCPACYRRHAATVEVCDCGRQLLVSPPVRKGAPSVATTTRCPTCGQTDGAPVSRENNGFGVVTITLFCRHCQQLYTTERVGLPQTPLIWLGTFFFVFWLAYFADPLLARVIVLVYIVVRTVSKINTYLDAPPKSEN